MQSTNWAPEHCEALRENLAKGMSYSEIAEAITHLAFYVGWPNVFSALPVAKDVFAKR